VPKGAREAIAAVVRTIFAQPDHVTAMTQLRKVAGCLRALFAQAATRCSRSAASRRASTSLRPRLRGVGACVRTGFRSSDLRRYPRELPTR
jgi:hypothetical protein